jgi:hypothetical protein
MTVVGEKEESIAKRAENEEEEVKPRYARERESRSRRMRA